MNLSEYLMNESLGGKVIGSLLSRLNFDDRDITTFDDIPK
jgi:hypothetical protein